MSPGTTTITFTENTFRALKNLTRNKGKRDMKQSILKVILKGEDWTFTKKFLMYEDYKIDEEDPHVKQCLDEAIDCLKLTADDVEFKTSKVLR